MTRARIDVSKVAIEIDLEGGLDTAVGDRVQLEQVLLNLIANALDAMQEVEDRPRILAIRSWRTREDIRVAVRDTGRGLPVGREDRIFSAFYTTKPDGIGMGLAISRSIVQAHGGQLQAESNPTCGAMFTVVLPVSNTPSGEAAVTVSAIR